MAWWNLGLKSSGVGKAGRVTTPPLKSTKAEVR